MAKGTRDAVLARLPADQKVPVRVPWLTCFAFTVIICSSLFYSSKLTILAWFAETPWAGFYSQQGHNFKK